MEKNNLLALIVLIFLIGGGVWVYMNQQELYEAKLAQYEQEIDNLNSELNSVIADNEVAIDSLDEKIKSKQSVIDSLANEVETKRGELPDIKDNIKDIPRDSLIHIINNTYVSETGKTDTTSNPLSTPTLRFVTQYTLENIERIGIEELLNEQLKLTKTALSLEREKSKRLQTSLTASQTIARNNKDLALQYKDSWEKAKKTNKIIPWIGAGALLIGIMLASF